MSLLEDGKPTENKTAMIYGKNDNSVFEFESERDKINCEFSDFQKRILEEILDEDKDLTIVPSRCGKTWLYDIIASIFIYEFMYDTKPNPNELLDFIGEALDSPHESSAIHNVSIEFVTPKERTISDIKKEIKHEKNPLRLKQLNKELNMKYKELKSGRK
jgi:hypothetical protein